jgi:CcmD family protein
MNMRLQTALGGVLRGAAFVLMTLVLRVPLLAAQPPAAQEEYLPIDQLPPSEQLPGGVFVIVAYGFIWVAVMAYLWSIWRRLSRVEAEMQALQRRGGGGKG